MQLSSVGWLLQGGDANNSLCIVPSPRKLGTGVLGYLLVDIGVETALGALCTPLQARLQRTRLQSASCSVSTKKHLR